MEFQIAYRHTLTPEVITLTLCLTFWFSIDFQVILEVLEH
jgi:hypothetical protein